MQPKTRHEPQLAEEPHPIEWNSVGGAFLMIKENIHIFFAIVMTSCRTTDSTTIKNVTSEKRIAEYPEKLFVSNNCSCASSSKSKIACWGDCFLEENLYGSNIIATESKKIVFKIGSHFCWQSSTNDEIKCNIVEGKKSVYSTPDKQEKIVHDFVQKTVSSQSIWSNQYDRFCAINNKDGFFCWNQRSNSSEGDSTRFSNFLQNEPAFQVKMLVLGRFHNCVLSKSGHMHCWGANGSGQCGKINSPKETHPIVLEGLTNIQDMALGQYHSCAIRAGEVYCWGDVGFVKGFSEKPSHIPEKMEGPEDFLKIVSGISYVCGLREAGSVECWFLSSGGRNRSIFVENLFSNVVDLAGGDEHACALMENRQIACWGENNVGQLAKKKVREDTKWNSATVVNINWELWLTRCLPAILLNVRGSKTAEIRATPCPTSSVQR